jgi:hypothetical protein
MRVIAVSLAIFTAMISIGASTDLRGMRPELTMFLRSLEIEARRVVPRNDVEPPSRGWNHFQNGLAMTPGVARREFARAPIRRWKESRNRLQFSAHPGSDSHCNVHRKYNRREPFRTAQGKRCCHAVSENDLHRSCNVRPEIRASCPRRDQRFKAAFDLLR